MALRILLADDSMTAQNMGKKILTDAGFEVVTVSNGAAAVKKLAESTPDIAILDVYMPGYTGLEVCERLKSVPGTAQVPVLLSVGKMEPFRPEDGMKVRADGVIIKPFEATDLVAVVEKLAERTYGAGADAAGAVPPPPPPEEEQPAAEGTAEGLETFTPVATAQPVRQEPGIEFTSVKDAEAASFQAAPQLEPTVFPDSQDVAPFAVATVAPPPPPPPAPVATPIEEPALMEQANDVELPIDEASISLPDAPFEFEEATGDASTVILEEVPVEGTDLPDTDIDIDADDLSLETEQVEASPEASVVDEAAAPEEAQEEVADWAPVAVAAEDEPISEEIDLDLEAEMQDEAAVTEAPVSEPPAEPVAPPPPIQQAEPFLSPLGKTSFDELDAVMEQAQEQQEADSFSNVVAEEIPVLEPIAETAEDAPVLLEETDSEEFVIHEMMNDQPADVSGITPEELVSAYETTSESSVAPVEGTEETIDGAIVEEPVLEEATASEDEVLELGADAPAPAAHDPLAFYGLSDVDQGDILQNPADTDDEPMFSLIEETDIAPIASAPADEPLLTEESPAETSDILEEEPVEIAPTPEEEIVTDVPPPVVPAVSMLEEVAAPLAVGAVAAAAAPAMAMAASPEPEPSELEPEPEFAIEPIDEPVSEMVLAEEPVEESVAEPVSPFEEDQIAQTTIVAAQPAIDSAIKEELLNGMAGRVVDRVVDRLKPILTVMVEEILAEVKKK